MSVGNVIVSPEKSYNSTENSAGLLLLLPKQTFSDVSYVCGPSNFVRIRGLDGPGTIHKHSLKNAHVKTHVRIKSRCKVPRGKKEVRARTREGSQKLLVRLRRI